MLCHANGELLHCAGTGMACNMAGDLNRQVCPAHSRTALVMKYFRAAAYSRVRVRSTCASCPSWANNSCPERWVQQAQCRRHSRRFQCMISTIASAAGNRFGRCCQSWCASSNFQTEHKVYIRSCMRRSSIFKTDWAQPRPRTSLSVDAQVPPCAQHTPSQQRCGDNSPLPWRCLLRRSRQHPGPCP